MNLILAVSENNVIGNDLEIPWDLKTDRAFFREKVKDKTVILGTNTLRSFKTKNGYFKPGKLNIVISKTLKEVPNGFILSTSVEDALRVDYNLFCIGGAKLYNYCLENLRDQIDYIYLTRVLVKSVGNCKVNLNLEDFKLLSSETFKENNLTYNIREYQNVRKFLRRDN